MDKRNEYRIVRWLGPATGRLWYRAECRRWWFPFWVEVDFFGDRGEAIACCEKHAAPSPAKSPPEYLGRLP